MSRGPLANRIAVALADDFDDHVPAALKATSAVDRLAPILDLLAAEEMAIDLGP